MPIPPDPFNAVAAEPHFHTVTADKIEITARAMLNDPQTTHVVMRITPATRANAPQTYDMVAVLKG